jgi:hypothetical protein
MVSGTLFKAGNPLTVGLNAGSGSATADLYAGVILPDNQTVVWFAGQGILGSTTSISALASFPAMQRLKPAVPLKMPALLQIRIPSGLPSGSYVLFAALVQPGALLDNSIDAGDIIAIASKAITQVQ